MTRYNTNKTTISRITDLGEEVRSALNMKNFCVAILFLTGHCATNVNALIEPKGEIEEIRLKKKVGSIEALLEYKPHVRVSKDSEHEDRIRAQRELNYTRVLGMEGYECMGTPTSANLTDNFVTWFITDGSVVGYLEKNTFECTAAYRVVEVLNCDRTVPRTTMDGRPVIPTVDVFDGKHGCADLIAAMNILHGEDSDDLEGETAETTRNLPDSDPYPSTCSGQWRACPYNVHYTGMISPITTTSDQRFHQRAHNIQGNQKEWQGCNKGYYIDMAGWERYRRATYYTSFGTLIDIYEGGTMQKCVAQDDWFVHTKGYATGTFCSTQIINARSTHTCGPRLRIGDNYCFSSNQEHCLMDFNTVPNDATQCNAVQNGPRSIQTKDAWCCDN